MPRYSGRLTILLLQRLKVLISSVTAANTHAFFNLEYPDTHRIDVAVSILSLPGLPDTLAISPLSTLIL